LLGLPNVLADHGKIKQVLLNLLTNAIKYNRDGGHIYVSGEVNGKRLILGVRDTGKGIPPESMPRIFEKFYRVPDSEGWSQGTGLGLAIAKRIVESHGGKLNVESTVNVGTTFSFSLPLA
jgi:signal transduction histidine kinase